MAEKAAATGRRLGEATVDSLQEGVDAGRERAKAGLLAGHATVVGSVGALTAGAMAIMPITALVLSYLLLREAFRWVHLAGFGLVFAGLVLMIVQHARGHETG